MIGAGVFPAPAVKFKMGVNKMDMAEIQGLTDWGKTLQSRSVWIDLKSGATGRIAAVGRKYITTVGGKRFLPWDVKAIRGLPGGDYPKAPAVASEAEPEAEVKIPTIPPGGAVMVRVGNMLLGFKFFGPFHTTAKAFIWGQSHANGVWLKLVEDFSQKLPLKPDWVSTIVNPEDFTITPADLEPYKTRKVFVILPLERPYNGE